MIEAYLIYDLVNMENQMFKKKYNGAPAVH